MTKKTRFRSSAAALAASTVLLLLMVAVVVIIGALPALAGTDDSIERPALSYSADLLSDERANCRYGTTPVDNNIPEQAEAIPRLGAGWFINFGMRWPYQQPANDPQFVHMLSVKQKKTVTGQYLQEYYTAPALDEDLRDYIRQHPNGIYIIGNEVDRGPQPGQIEGGQGDMYPDMYAQAYHEIYHWIKRAAPSAQVAVSGLVQVTPGRLQYLDLVWKAYRDKYGVDMPVDVWTMHLYVLPEVEPDGVTPNGIANVALGTDPRLGKRSSGGSAANCADADVYCFAEHDDMGLFAEQVVAMRQWMKNHGQQNRPLLLTEYSILYPYIPEGSGCFLQDEFGNCFTPQRVSNFMRNTFDYLNSARNPNLGYPLDDNRLVQQWLWFSMYTQDEGSSSNLLKKNLQDFTLIGQTFRDYVHNEPLTQNLVAQQAANVIANAGANGKATARISVSFRNNGNSAVTTPFTVTFYRDKDLTQPIGSAVIEPSVHGCAGVLYTASVSWSGLTPGVYDYWAHVDSQKVIGESLGGESDNTAKGQVTVYLHHILLPLSRG